MDVFRTFYPVFIAYITLLSLSGINTLNINPQGSPFDFTQSCPDGWDKVPETSDDDPSGRHACLRGYDVPSTWEDALSTCRTDWGHLLVLDDSVLGDLSSPTLHAAVTIMNSKSLASIWTSLHTTNYRLNWEYTTPVKANIYHATWHWEAGQPSSVEGCGLLRFDEVTQNAKLAMALANCSTKAAFICFTWSSIIRPQSGVFCPEGWQGDLRLGICLQYQSTEKAFTPAAQLCEEKEGRLAIPKSDNLHALTTFVAMLHSSSVMPPEDLIPPAAPDPSERISCYTCTSAYSESECSTLSRCLEGVDACESRFHTVVGQTSYMFHKTCSSRERCIPMQENTMPACQQGLDCVQCCYTPGCNEHLFAETHVWLGLKNTTSGWQWLDQSPVEDFNRFVEPEHGSCGSLKGDLYMWEAEDCAGQLPFICQRTTLAVKEAVFTEHPKDLETTAEAIETGSLSSVQFPGESSESSPPVLTCNADNVDPGMNVVWVKDGSYIDNGQPPDGFRMNLSVDASGQLPIFDAGALALQGNYACEVWGIKHHKRIRSRSALVRFTDVFTYQVSLTITNANLREGSILGVLTSQSTVWPEQLKGRNMFNELFDLGEGLNALLPQTIVITMLRRGSIMVDLVIYHRRKEDKLPELQQALLQLGLSANVDYKSLEKNLHDLLLHTATRRLEESAWKVTWSQFFIPSQSLSIRSTYGCRGLSETYNDISYTWPDAKLGEVVHSLEICFSSGLPLANRTCEGDFNVGVYWGEVRPLDHCDELKVSPISEALKNISQIEVNETNAQEVATRVNELTKNTEVLEILDIMLSSTILNKLVTVNKLNNETSENFLSTVNNVLEAKSENIRDAQLMGQSSTKILTALSEYSLKTDLGTTNNSFQVQSNIAADVWGTSQTDTLPLGYGAVYTNEELNKETIRSYTDSDQVNVSNIDAAIVLSPEVIQRIKDAQAARPSSVNDFLGPIRLSYFIFRKGDLFLTPSNIGSSFSLEQIANSKVVAGTVNNVVIKDLQQPIMTIFKPFKGMSGEPLCVYWDFAAAGGRGNWSSEGCYYNGTQNDRSICLCSHLTNFAILGSFDQSQISEGHRLALSIISVIGLTLSIIGLTFTILTFLCFRRFRKGRGQKVLFNLALSLLAVNVTFLAGINETGDEIACKIVAALIQYFLLVSFAWMMVEAVVQYYKFVKVLDTYVDHFMLKASIPAWGIPTVPVIAVACIDHDLFRGHPDYCWLDLPAFYFAFLTPVAVVIIINSFLFILVIKGITCDRPNLQSTRNKSDFRMLQVRAGVTCFIVLGITWIFGFLAIADARLVFQYLFCVCNSFQGFLIFIFYNIREKAVRDAWHQCFKSSTKSNKYESNTTDSTTPSKKPTKTYENLAFNGSK